MYAERVGGCDGDGNAGVGAGGGVLAVSTWCECMGGIRGSGFVSTADDVLEMSVVRGVDGVGCCCLPSESYGRNGVTQIVYIILSTKVSFLEDAILFFQCLLFSIFVYISNRWSV